MQNSSLLVAYHEFKGPNPPLVDTVLFGLSILGFPV